MNWRITMYANGFLTIFQEEYIGKHSWKIVRTHLHAWLFSNPCGKVLIIVGILWSQDLRVQHNLLKLIYK